MSEEEFIANRYTVRKGDFLLFLPGSRRSGIGGDNPPVISTLVAEEEKLNVPFSRAFLADGACEKGPFYFSFSAQGDPASAATILLSFRLWWRSRKS